ncbi:hypothetical protein HELRODRAFT_171540 [Helobdella robusta]|uniref:PPM-type phosphatase domain-containing protein n=1 Tax=Helobdella robusta TaxID=6412 RepID=T1F4E2_HELRO|nr:hypothetical protein HELRODRAFT_171540 [Helobdella robusta]ESO05198.1 hypothetical protein HELRODRAFT_171540 [Helobdella robusta]
MMQYNCIGLGYKSKFNCDVEDPQSFNEECFCTRLTDDLLLYGLCIGYNGNKVSKYVAKHFAVKFLNFIEDAHNADSKINSILIKHIFQQSENELECASVLIALNHKNKLHVAYTGCSRALLVMGDDKLYHVNQLTTEHNMLNSKEIQRLTELGLDCSKLGTSELCGHPFTRCIGGLNLKKHFQNYPLLSKLLSSPWICEPDVIEPVQINDSSHTLVLVSNNIIFKIADSGCSPEKINDAIFTKIQQQIQIHPNMNNAAQRLIEEISSYENKTFCMFSHESSYSIIIHNFKNPYLSNTVKKATYRNINALPPLTIDVGNNESELSQLNSLQLDFRLPELFSKKNVSRSETMKSVDDMLKSTEDSNLILRKPEKLAPYVDFSAFYANSSNADLIADSKALRDFEIISENILKS